MRFKFRFLIPLLAWCLLAANAFAQTSSPTRARSTSTNSNNSRTGSNRTTNSSPVGANANSTGTRQYRSNTMLGDATIQVDPETRSLVVVTDEATHNEMLKVIDNLDHPKPQVLIKVVFVEVTLDKNLDVGLEGSYSFRVGSGSTSILTGSSASIINTATVQSLFGLAQKSNGTVAAVTASNWSATLHALESKGNLRVLSRPSIMARNNQEAVIVVGQEVPFITNSQITDLGATINTIQYRDVGIILRVTPFINSNKTIEMIVSPEISKISDQTVPISSSVNAAVIDKRSAETVVVTPDATTVVIGGMMQKQEQNTLDKVPILGSIPVLGIPFRHNVKSTVKTELLIFLTPYIVEGKEKLKDMTLGESNRADMIRDGFTPEEINPSLGPLQLLDQNYPTLPTKDEPAKK